MTVAFCWHLYRTAWKQAGRILQRALVPPFLLVAFVGGMLARAGDLGSFQSTMEGLPSAHQVGWASAIGVALALTVMRPLRITLLHPTLAWWLRQPLSTTTPSAGWTLLLHPASAFVVVLALAWPGPFSLLRALAWSVGWLPLATALALRSGRWTTVLAAATWPAVVAIERLGHPHLAIPAALTACALLGPMWQAAWHTAAASSRTTLPRLRVRSPGLALLHLHLRFLAHSGLGRTLAVPLAALPGAALLAGLVRHQTLNPQGTRIAAMVLVAVAMFPAVSIGARLADHHGDRLLRVEWPVPIRLQALALAFAVVLPTLPGAILTLGAYGPGLPPPAVVLQPLLLAATVMVVVLRLPGRSHQPVNAGTWLVLVGAQQTLCIVLGDVGALVALSLSAVLLELRLRAWSRAALQGAQG